MTKTDEAATAPTAEEDFDRRLIGAAELKRQLGNVSDSWLYRAQQDQTLGFPQPAKIRGRRFWRRGDVARWIDSQTAAVRD